MITTTEMIAEISAGELLNLYATTIEVSVVVARPANKNDYLSVITDIYAGLTSHGEPQDPSNSLVHSEALLFAKLSASNASNILIMNCENLVDSTLEKLTLTAQATNTRMVLAYGIDAGQRVREWAASFNIPDTDWQDLDLPPANSTKPHCHVNLYPVDLPPDNFITFRSACQAFLTLDEFKVVDARYVEAFRKAHANVSDEPKRVQDLINGQLPKTYSTQEATIIIMATQAAFLLHGYFMKVDLDQLLSIISDKRTIGFDSDDWMTLLQLPETEAAALAALTHEGYSLEDCAALTIFDKPEIRNPYAQQILRMHKIFASIVQAEEHLFKDTPVRWRKRIETTLRRVGLGLRTPSPSMKSENERWQYKYGLYIQKVTA